MKKGIKIFIMACIVTLGFIFVGCKGTSIDENKNKDISNINEIFIDVSSTDVNVIPEDRGDVKVNLYGEEFGNVKHKFSVDLDDDTLKIEVKFKGGVTVGGADLKLDVYVPENYKDTIKVDGSSGNFDIKDMHLSNLTIDLSSGDTNIEDMNLTNLSIDLSSGGVNIKNSNAEEFEYDASSGDLIGDNINAKTVYYDVSSGKVKLESFQGNIEGESNSGDITVEYKKFNNNIDLQASSGNVIVDLPDDAEFYLDAKVSSGDINCTFPIQIQSKSKEKELKGIVVSDKSNIKIKTTSGDIDIR